jgi:hypothetical protein
MNTKEYDEIMEIIEGLRNDIKEVKELIENLALMTQREFLAMRGEMKEMDKNIRGDLRGEIQQMDNDLRGEIRQMDDDLRGEIRHVREGLHEEIEDLRREMRAGFAAITGVVTNHEYRIERVEKRTGIL